jgi:hypothetical protein
VVSKKPKTKPKSTRAEAARRNGLRGGRPSDASGPPGIPWTRVRYYAALGGDRDTIVVALGISPEQLADPAVLERLQQELARGSAQHQLNLLENIERLRNGGKGSINATLAGLRHAAGWDQKESGKARDSRPPDNESAIAELERVLRRFRAPG